jgi:peptidylprolyl isomerase
MTVGVDHPRLPGLGLTLVGMAPGARTKVTVPPEQAYGMPDPGRVFRLARTRFPAHQVLPIGKWVHILDRHGRRRLVRILEARAKLVVVDNNHPQAGQALDLEVELVSIQTPATGSDSQGR